MENTFYLEPIPKIDRIIATFSSIAVRCDLFQKEIKHNKKDRHRTIINIPDELWDEIKAIFYQKRNHLRL